MAVLTWTKRKLGKPATGWSSGLYVAVAWCLNVRPYCEILPFLTISAQDLTVIVIELTWGCNTHLSSKSHDLNHWSSKESYNQLAQVTLIIMYVPCKVSSEVKHHCPTFAARVTGHKDQEDKVSSQITLTSQSSQKATWVCSACNVSSVGEVSLVVSHDSVGTTAWALSGSLLNAPQTRALGLLTLTSTYQKIIALNNLHFQKFLRILFCFVISIFIPGSLTS